MSPESSQQIPSGSASPDAIETADPVNAMVTDSSPITGDHFLIEEYKMLRVEIESYTKQKRQLEMAIFTAISALYGWSLSLTINDGVGAFAIWLPALVVAFGVYRTIYYNVTISKQVDYIQTHIETRFLPKGGGWEEYWRSNPSIKILKRSEWIFWITLAAVSISVPLLSLLCR